jgi:hypothetical protein
MEEWHWVDAGGHARREWRCQGAVGVAEEDQRERLMGLGATYSYQPWIPLSLCLAPGSGSPGSGSRGWCRRPCEMLSRQGP